MPLPVNPLTAGAIFVIGGTAAVVTYIAYARADEAGEVLGRTDPEEWLPPPPWEGPPVPRLALREPERFSQALARLWPGPRRAP
jgi:hypothetical protein